MIWKIITQIFQTMKMINLTDKTKGILLGFLAILIVIVFAYSVSLVFQSANKKELRKLEEINSNAKTNAAIATAKANDLASKNDQLKLEVIKIKSELGENNKILNKFQTSYSNSLNELNKYKNEKDFVPDNASINEQSDYLSKYKYKPY